MISLATHSDPVLHHKKIFIRPFSGLLLLPSGCLSQPTVARAGKMISCGFNLVVEFVTPHLCLFKLFFQACAAAEMIKSVSQHFKSISSSTCDSLNMFSQAVHLVSSSSLPPITYSPQPPTPSPPPYRRVGRAVFPLLRLR